MPPNVSIILTIHNKESLVDSVIKAIAENSTTNYEFLCILDGCTDNSKNFAQNAIDKYTIPEYSICETPDVYETIANNIGMKEAKGDYFILVQDDMIVDEKGWDERLIKPLMAFDDVAIVSSRLACNILPKKNIHNIHEDVFVDMADSNTIKSRDQFAIRKIIARGPVALNAEKIKRLNYLDIEYAPYTWDDVDLCARAYKEFGWLCGYYESKCISKPEWGTTRTKTANAHFWNITCSRNSGIFYTRHSDFVNLPNLTQNRYLP